MRKQIEKFLSDITVELVPREKLWMVDKLRGILKDETGWTETVQAEARIAMSELRDAIVNRKFDIRSPRKPGFDSTGWKKLEDYPHKTVESLRVRILTKNGRYKVSLYTSQEQLRRFFCNTLEAARNVASQFSHVKKKEES